MNLLYASIHLVWFIGKSGHYVWRYEVHPRTTNSAIAEFLLICRRGSIYHLALEVVSLAFKSDPIALNLFENFCVILQTKAIVRGPAYSSSISRYKILLSEISSRSSLAQEVDFSKGKVLSKPHPFAFNVQTSVREVEKRYPSEFVVVAIVSRWPFTSQEDFNVMVSQPHIFSLNAQTSVCQGEEICRSKFAASPYISSWPFASEWYFSAAPSKPQSFLLSAQTLVSEGK